MSGQWENIPIGKIINPIETCDPRKCPNDKFEYIDVSSVSRTTLTVTEPTTLRGAEAPSRARRRVRAGDVIFATIRPTLTRVAQIPPELDGAICSTGFFPLRPNEGFLSRYIFYWLLGSHFVGAMEKLQRGASYPAVSDGDVRNQTISIPSFSEQKRIVAILDEAFTGIETAIANTEKNLANARELFESYLDSVFQNGGSGWQETTFGDIYQIGSSKRVHKKDWRESGVPFYRAREIVKLAEHGTVENDLFISEDLFADFSSKTGAPQQGDLMVTAVGTLGICYVVQHSDRFYFKDASVLWFRPRQPINDQFIKYAFRSPTVRRQTTDSQGATVGTLTISRANSISISVPSLEVQNEVASSLSTLEAEVLELQSVLKAKLTSLKELKQSLLQKAFSGELTADRAQGA